MDNFARFVVSDLLKVQITISVNYSQQIDKFIFVVGIIWDSTTFNERSFFTNAFCF